MSKTRILDLLDGYPDFEKGRSPGSAPFNLDRTRRLLDALDRPDRRYRIVHIGGTKGKGSTAVMLSSMLAASGLRCGLYSSPHLLDFTERISVNGTAIGQDELVETMNERILPAVARLPEDLGGPTLFELITVLALEVFARRNVDVAVIEVGLGGSLDATNAIEPPEVVVLTPISLDHTAILGSTIAEIAGDKSGIIKTGARVVVAPQLEAASAVIEESCRQAGAELGTVASYVSVRRGPSNLEGQSIQIETTGVSSHVRLPFPGRHQAENAATAVAAALAFEGDSATGTPTLASFLTSALLTEGYAETHTATLPHTRGSSSFQSWSGVSNASIRLGLEGAPLRGRFEVVSRVPCIVVDVAHNHASALALAATVEEVFGARVTYVVGMSSDKDHEAFCRALDPSASRFICVQARHPRSVPASQLASAFRHVSQAPVEVRDSVADGLTLATEGLGPREAIVVTGSFYSVAEAMTEWTERLQA